ncbi:MAG: glycosyltransferase family 39 protein [Armatimonadetes bacterium]|nr:glycosyltransferase family 39 protein [Armatimonadota bacterium]MDW8028631.1 glycosyltransferase family 39 protein [Armatimonadota bacterium]
MSKYHVLFLLAAVLFGWMPAISIWLNSPTLIGDEAYYARVPVEMRERGDWIVPYFNGEPRYKKPPLMYWLVALSQSAFGENEFASRLPSFIAVVLTGFILAWFGSKVGAVETGLWAAAAFLLNPMTAVLGNWGAPEATLCLFVTASVLFGLLWLFNGSLRWLLLSGIAAGLGILTKGAPGLVLPILALLTASVWEYLRQKKAEFGWNQLKRLSKHFGLWFITCLSVAAPWFIAVWVYEGEKFWQVFLFREHIQRVAEPMEGHHGPIWFYLLVIWILFMPWSVCLPHAFANAVKTFHHYPSFNSQSVDFTMAWWSFVVFMMFSLIATKLPHYIFPIFPAMAWLVASQIQRSLTESEFWIGLLLAFLPVPVLFFLAFAGTYAYTKFLTEMGFKPGLEVDAIRLATYTLLSGFASVSLIWCLSKTQAIFFESGEFFEKRVLLLGGVILTIVTLVSVPIIIHASGSRKAINTWTKFQDIATLGSDTEWSVFYAKRTVKMLGRKQEELHNFLTKHPDTAILARVDFAPILKREGLVLKRFGIWCVASKKEDKKGDGS